MCGIRQSHVILGTGHQDEDAMKREIGKTGVFVFPVGLGAMPLSIQNRPDEVSAVRVLRAAWDAGIQFVDTANVYCLNDDDIGHNERLIKEALKQRPGAEIYIGTKGGLQRPGGRWTNDARPHSLKCACERSLKDLGMDSIFLYQLHAPDPGVPFADSLGALIDLKREGKIQHIGISNVTNEQVIEALHLTRIETIQNRANPFWQKDYRTAGIVELCIAHSMTFLPYSTVGGQNHHHDVTSHEALIHIAKKHEATPYQVIIAWHLAQSPRVIPIPGASRPESIRSSVKAREIILEPTEIDVISALQDV